MAELGFFVGRNDETHYDNGGVMMPSITIRKLDEELAQRLCIRAARHGCSMEEGARNILRATLEQETDPTEALGTTLHAIFKPFGDVTFLPESQCANRRASIETLTMVILDTNVISELMRDSPEQRGLAWLDTQPTNSLFVTTITQAEILNVVSS